MPPPALQAASPASGGGRADLAPLASVGVQALAQFLAALEEGHGLGADRDGLAGAGVAARAGGAAAYGEGAEAAQLHPAAVFERLGHGVEDDRHHALDVLL